MPSRDADLHAALRALARPDLDPSARTHALTLAARLGRLDDAVAALPRDGAPELAATLGALGYGFGDPRVGPPFPLPRVVGAAALLDGSGWLQLSADRVLRRGDGSDGAVTEVARLPPGPDFGDGEDPVLFPDLEVGVLRVGSDGRRLLVACFYVEDDDDRREHHEVTVLELATGAVLLHSPPAPEARFWAATPALDAVVLGPRPTLYRTDGPSAGRVLPGPPGARCDAGWVGPGPNRVALLWVTSQAVARCYDARRGTTLWETPPLASVASVPLEDLTGNTLRTSYYLPAPGGLRYEAFDAATGAPRSPGSLPSHRPGRLVPGPGFLVRRLPGKGVVLVGGLDHEPTVRGGLGEFLTAPLETGVVPYRVGPDVGLVELRTGTVRTRRDTHRDPVSRLEVVAAPGGEAALVSVAETSGERRLWDVATGAVREAWVEGPCGGSVRGDRRLGCDPGGRIEVTDHGGALVARADFDATLDGDVRASLAPGGAAAVLAAKDQVLLVELTTGAVRWRYRAPRGGWGMSGAYLDAATVVLSHWANQDARVLWLDAATGEVLGERTWRTPTRRVPVVRAAQDPRWLVVETGYRGLVFDRTELRSRFVGGDLDADVCALALTPDRRRVVAAGTSGALWVEEVESGAVVAEGRVPGPPVRAMATLPGRTELVVAQGAVLRRVPFPAG